MHLVTDPAPAPPPPPIKSKLFDFFIKKYLGAKKLYMMQVNWKTAFFCSSE